MQNIFLSVIISNKNALKWLDRCFKSIQSQGFKNYEIIFIDNCSSDSSVDFVKNKYPSIKIHLNKSDLGFAGAANIGASLAKGNFLVFINTDTYFGKNVFQSLVDAIIKYGDNNIFQFDIKYYDKSNLKKKPFGFGMDYFGYPIGDGNFFYADGAAFAIKTSLFRKLGGYDEKYYMYLEDLDLCWRARMVGTNIQVLPKVYVFHYGGGTSSAATGGIQTTYTTTLDRRYHAQKNNLRSLIKNYSLINILWSLPSSIFLAIGESLFYLYKGNIKGFLILNQSVLWNLFNIKDTLKKRSEIQKIRTVGDWEILKLCDKRISKLHSLRSHGIPLMK